MGTSLRHRSFRRYLAAMAVSNTGMWLQQTAELWLVLQLTGSGTALGIHAVLRHAPMLLLGAYGGLLSDRWDRRRLLITTQAAHTAATAVLAVSTLWGTPDLLMVYGIVAVQGIINAVDQPLRRTFIRNLVDDDAIANAISLNGSVAVLTRTIGPAIGGVLIATVGVELCFTLNAVSYTAVLLVLARLERASLRTNDPVPRAKGQLTEGLRYAWQVRSIRTNLILALAVSAFGWNWHTLLPVYATEELAGGAAFYGAMLSILSAGSFVGTLLTARVADLRSRHVMWPAASVVVALAVLALAPTLVVAIIGLVLLGASGTGFNIASQARVQLRADDQMVGRVVALYSTAFLGIRPVGGLLGGWLVDLASSRVAFGAGAVAIALTLAAVLAVRHHRSTGQPAPDDHPPQTDLAVDFDRMRSKSTARSRRGGRPSRRADSDKGQADPEGVRASGVSRGRTSPPGPAGRPPRDPRSR